MAAGLQRINTSAQRYNVDTPLYPLVVAAGVAVEVVAGGGTITTWSPSTK